MKPANWNRRFAARLLALVSASAPFRPTLQAALRPCRNFWEITEEEPTLQGGIESGPSRPRQCNTRDSFSNDELSP